MKVKYLFLTLLVGVIMFSCKKDFKHEPDNIFKFRDYISFTTSGLVSIADPIKIDLAKEVDSWEANTEISSKIINISPEIEGKLTVLNNRSLLFQPSKTLEPNTEYTVTILLHKIYNNIPAEFKTFTFKFKTIQQNFSINTTNFQSYNREWKYIEGLLKTTDVLTLENAKTVLSASQKNKNLKIKWNESDSLSTQFQFIIDSVQRFEEDSEVIISWSGNKINVENEGESTFRIPGKNNFNIFNIEVIQSPEQYLKINFSDPIKMQQNFDGLVEIQNNKNVTFTVDGNILKVFPSARITGNVFSSNKNFSDNKTYSIFQKILKKGKTNDFLQMTESENPGIRIYGFWALLKKGKNELAKKVLESEISKSDKVQWNFSGYLIDELLVSDGMEKLLILENKNGS